MKKVTFLALSCLFVMMANFYTAEAQDCFDSVGCTSSSGLIPIELNLTNPDCTIILVYEKWICGGITSIKIHSYGATGACTAMDEFSIYHYNISSLEEMISLTLIQDLDINPICPLTAQRIKIYTASCGIWVGCEYEITNAPRVCDAGFAPPYPDDATPGKVKVYKWQSCGTVCCVNTYDVCEDEAFGITNVTKVSSVQAGDCSGQLAYNPKMCQTGCR